MKQVLSLVLVLCCAVAIAAAQPPLTSIQDTIYDQFGTLYNGPLVISLSAQTASAGGKPIKPVQNRDLMITNGVLSTTLIPNSAITPANTVYIMSFSGVARRVCTIPVSTTPVTLSAYCTDNPPANPSPVIPLSWLAPVAVGQQLCGTGTGVVPGVCMGTAATWGNGIGLWGGQ